MSELIGVGRALLEATQDRAKRDENELASAQKDLEHLRNISDYYRVLHRQLCI